MLILFQKMRFYCRGLSLYHISESARLQFFDSTLAGHAGVTEVVTANFTFKGLISTLLCSHPHCQHVSPQMSHAYRNQQSQPSAAVHPPLSLHPVSHHVGYSLMVWRTLIPMKGTIDFLLKVWIRCSEPWNSRNTRSALTFLLYLLNRQTSLGCLTDTQSHLLHKSQRSAERSLLQACQNMQKMLDYKYTLQPNSMHRISKTYWHRISKTYWHSTRREEKHWHEGKALK